jgi:hypothetical protein
MAGSDTTTLSGLLKRNYGGGSKLFQQNLKAYMWGELETSPDKPAGEGFFHMTYIRGNESGGAINEDEATADPQSPQPIQPIVTAKVNHWPFSFTGKAVAVSDSDKYAFASAIDSNMQDAQARAMSDKNRQTFGNGIGTLTQVNGAVSASATIIVDNVQYMRVNQLIDIFDVVGGTKEAAGRKIMTIDIGTNTITVDLAVTVSDNAVIVKKGVQDNPPADGKELTGLQKIVDTTTEGVTFQGVNRSTFPEYQSNVIDAGAVPVSQDLLQRLMNRIMIVGGENPNLIVSRHGVYRTFVNATITQTRYQDDKLKAGHVTLTWNGLDWVLDKDCQTGTVYFLNTNPQYLAKYVVRDTDLADEDGKTVNKLPGFDKYYGYYISYDNIGSRKPNNQGKLINLIEPTF